MKCVFCSFENPDNMRYCGGCGAKLEQGCPDCGYDNPPHFKFCGQCGGKLDSTPKSETLDARVAAVEKQMICKALDRADWIQTRAAEILGISERVLRYKIKKHNIGKES